MVSKCKGRFGDRIPEGRSSYPHAVLLCRLADDVFEFLDAVGDDALDDGRVSENQALVAVIGKSHQYEAFGSHVLQIAAGLLQLRPVIDSGNEHNCAVDLAALAEYFQI